MSKSALGAIVAAALTAGFAASVDAQETSPRGPDFRGKTIQMIIGFGPGASNDLYGRLVARHIGKYIPGEPSVTPQNMPGAGSFKAANHIYNIAPKDGTVMGIVAQTLATEEALGATGIQFKAAKFNWIGRVTSDAVVSFMWHTSKVKTVQDAMKIEAPVGATGASSTVTIYPAILNAVVGTKLKLVMGYKSSSAAMLAMEQGEVEGAATGWGGMKVSKQDWIRDKKVNIIVQYAPERHPDLPDVPTSVELGQTPEDKQILGLYANDAVIGKSILAPPDMAPAIVKALRAAFDAAMKDPELLAEIKKTNADFDPLPGEKLQKIVEDGANIPPAVLARAKAIHPANAKP